MITLKGCEWGTAAEIAARLGGDVTEDMVRNWAARDGLAKVRVPGPGQGTVWYPLDQAARIEAAKRIAKEQTGRGRPRRLDIAVALG